MKFTLTPIYTASAVIKPNSQYLSRCLTVREEMELDFIELTLPVLLDRVCRLSSFTHRSIDHHGHRFFWSARFDACFYKNLDPHALYRLRKLEKPDWLTEKIPTISCWV